MTNKEAVEKLVDLIYKSGVVSSKNEIRRLLTQNAIKVVSIPKGDVCLYEQFAKN
jgi:hypothetical protein